MALLTSQLLEMGYTVIPDLIASTEIDSIARSMEVMLTEGVGTRRLIDTPWCGALAERIARDARLRETLPVAATAVQCTLFVKSIEKIGWSHFIRTSAFP